MIPLVLVMLLMGTQAQLPNLLGSFSNGPKSSLRIVDDFAKEVVNKGSTAVVQLEKIPGKDSPLADVTKVVKQETGAIAQPVESAVLMTATSQCEAVKKVLRIDYTSRTHLRDEDLNELSLQFITASVRVTFNITEAAQLIPASRDFDPNLPLIIFAHGFLSIPDSERFSSLVDAFRSKGQYNVLALDSSAYIHWFYLRATTYVRFSGEKLGEVLATMVQHGLNPKSIHLIGHSLGAHISAFAGKKFTQLTGLRVGRISGLDPAGPCFFNEGSDLKLNATDADYVDVIHTADGTLGLTEPIGQADFYPNGGTQQPGCLSQVCSHELVWQLYSESIFNPEAFIAVKCTGWDQFRANQCEQDKVVMGYGATPDVQGLFFLQTRSNSPYGLGEAGAKYANTEGVLKSIQRLGPDAPLG